MDGDGRTESQVDWTESTETYEAKRSASKNWTESTEAHEAKRSALVWRRTDAVRLVELRRTVQPGYGTMVQVVGKSAGNPMAYGSATAHTERCLRTPHNAARRPGTPAVRAAVIAIDDEAALWPSGRCSLSP